MDTLGNTIIKGCLAYSHFRYFDYLLAPVLAPQPRFADFPCQYNGMHCRDADKEIESLNKQLVKTQVTLAALPKLVL